MPMLMMLCSSFSGSNTRGVTVDPTMREALETRRIAEEAVDEAINRLLNEAAEKILKED
jgi:hypothetical protein